MERAREIAEAGADGGMTLRQLFYRLDARGYLPNDITAYSTLSHKTAEARRAKTFPALVDRTRAIDSPLTFEDAEHAREFSAACSGSTGSPPKSV